MKFKYSLTLLAAGIAMVVNSLPLQAADIDDQIESSAKSSYVFRTYLTDEVKVDSQEGVVTLTGTVNERSDISLAEDTVSSLPGVNSVENELTVKDDTPAENSDAWLITKVKTTLLFHRNVSALTNVSAMDGVITLRGVADNQAEKDLASEYAMDIEGVSKVNNEMTIAAMSNEETTSVGEMIDDASITAQVKLVLLSHRSTSALHTSVETKDGVVTLSGEAQNEAEIALATKISGDTHGVKEVNNMMIVAR